MSDANIKVMCDGFPPDSLKLREFRGHDELGRMFQFELQVLHDDHDIAFDRFLGKAVTLKIPVRVSSGGGAASDGGANPTEEERFFNGIVVNATYTGAQGRFASYRLSLAPKLWTLTLASNCRIFQKKTIREIIQKMLADHGISGQAFDDSKLTGHYEKKDFVVQYRETDFNFVSRLMEQEGIYYFFKHGDKFHTTVLVDASSGHGPVPGLEELAYLPPSQAKITSGDCIRHWSVSSKVGSHKYAHNDFDFKRPRSKLVTTAQASNTPLKGEIYDYPGEFIYDEDGVAESKEGERYARIRLEELRALTTVAHAETTSISLFAGAVFQFNPGSQSARQEDKRKYLIQAASYVVAGRDWESGGGATGGDTWSTDMTVIDHNVPYRPTRITPKPLISGPQTAVVVGKTGDEIFTDKYGRVKLQFHWDRDSKGDEESSCWVRVAQIWAGKKWGGIHLPRIGQEVIVEFLEGDPDQPIVTGRVYNGDNLPPYDLPANASQSGVKSRSTKGGEVADFNELRFEDKKGQEQVYLHAQKDMKTIVEKDDTLEVGKNQTIKIKNNLTETVEDGNHTLTISKGKSIYEAKQSILIKVGQSSVLIDNAGVTIKGATIKIEGTAMIDQKAPMTTIKGDATVTIKGGIVMIN